MSNEFVSIIVPVYNMKDYIVECLDSIINQTYQNIEIIIVLDCPTDGSDVICREYAAKYSRIKIVEFPENLGLVAGRKAGVLAASAERIMFVDADDYIKRDMVHQFMEQAHDFDLVVGRHVKMKNGRLYEYNARMSIGTYQSEDEMRTFFSGVLTYSKSGEQWDAGFYGSAWAKLYKRDLLLSAQKGISNEMYFYEDFTLTIPYALSCRSILITDICGYVYRIRGKSMAHSTHDDILYQLHLCYKILSDSISAHPMRESLQGQLEAFMRDSLIRAGTQLGFSAEKRIKSHIFPFINLLDGKRIALYASGMVGKDYYYQIKKQNFCTIDMWVSKNWEREQAAGLDVSPVSDLLKDTYDYVVIAVEREDMAEEIRQELIALGVKKEKILWRKPIYTASL